MAPAREVPAPRSFLPRCFRSISARKLSLILFIVLMMSESGAEWTPASRTAAGGALPTLGGCSTRTPAARSAACNASPAARAGLSTVRPFTLARATTRAESGGDSILYQEGFQPGHMRRVS